MALTDFMEPCERLRFSGTDNGLGGQAFVQTSETPCLAAFDLNSGGERDSAGASSAVKIWTVLVREGVSLTRGDILRRDRDGKRFRIVLHGERRLPAFSALGVTWYQAEEVETP